MSQFYHPDTGTQPTPVVKPEQHWQAPQYYQQPEMYYAPQVPIPPTQPAPPPRKRMPLDRKIALGVIIALVVAVSLVAGIAVAVGNSTPPQVNQDATAPALTATAQAYATLVATGVTGLSNDLTQTAMTPTAQPTLLPSPTPQNDIGSTQQASAWSVTLNSVKEGQGDGYLGPKPGNIYLYFNLTAQNTDTSNHLISVIDFTVLDSDGNKYGIAVDSNVQDLSGTVVAGQKLRGYVIYEVPKSVHQFTLQFDPSFDLSQVVQWNISI